MLAFGIKERETDAPVQQFVRLEFVPPDPFTLDLEKWTEHVDEHEVPEWFDDAARFDAFEQMRDLIRASVVTDKRDLLLGGFWILAEEAEVKSLKCGKAGRVSDSAKIGSVYGSAKIGYVFGSAKIDYVYDSAKIDYVYDSAKIGYVSDSAKIGSVFGSAKIGSVFGSAKIGSVYGSAKIGYVSDSAKIGKDDRNEKTKAGNPLPTEEAVQ